MLIGQNNYDDEKNKLDSFSSFEVLGTISNPILKNMKTLLARFFEEERKKGFQDG